MFPHIVKHTFPHVVKHMHTYPHNTYTHSDTDVHTSKVHISLVPFLRREPGDKARYTYGCLLLHSTPAFFLCIPQLVVADSPSEGFYSSSSSLVEFAAVIPHLSRQDETEECT